MTDRIVEAARFLASQIEYSRHQLWVDELFAAVAAALAKIRFTVDGPNEQKYLGPCGAPLSDCDDPYPDGQCSTCVCEGDVYGARGGSRGRCRTCGAEVAQDERQAWLDGEVRSHAFRASEIEDAYGVKANLIRQWATPARGLIQIHGHDRDGRALYLLSHVLDVAATQAAKRAEAQAKRARSQATRTREDAA